MQQPNDDRILNFDEAAKYLGIGVPSLTSYISNGRLIARRDGNSGEYIFYESELATYKAAHPRGHKPSLSVVKEDQQEETNNPEQASQKDLTMRVLLDYVTRSHVEGQETVKVTFKYPEYERNGDIPYNSFVFRDPDMQAFFASLPVGQEFEMVLRKRKE